MKTTTTYNRLNRTQTEMCIVSP